jgi:hypothetical protein
MMVNALAAAVKDEIRMPDPFETIESPSSQPGP